MQIYRGISIRLRKGERIIKKEENDEASVLEMNIKLEERNSIYVKDNLSTNAPWNKHRAESGETCNGRKRRKKEPTVSEMKKQQKCHQRKSREKRNQGQIRQQIQMRIVNNAVELSKMIKRR